MKYNNQKFTIILPLFISLSVALGLFLGKIIWDNASPSASSVGRGKGKIDMTIDYITRNYVDTISRHKLEEDALPALLAKLDPHSSYIPAADFNDVNDPLEGEFEGIGVQFNIQGDTIVVMQVISGGPSERVGLHAGDRIVMVNDSLMAGKKITSTMVVRKLKGPRGTKVKVGIARRGVKGLTDFVITRDKIPFYSIDASFMANKETGYIKISRFATTTFDEFADHAGRLIEKGMRRLVLDLRGNGGGVLQMATLIANEFLQDGSLIVYTQGRSFPREDFVADGNGNLQDVKLVILIDEETASASEILSGAIQDNDRGLIIGRRSFGKGLVMEQQMFPDGSAIRLTISRYFTPTGRCIQKPYDEDHDKYYAEITERYINKELQSQDSIKLPDSLKYTTPGGRTVYGGGGIMPDVFVPLDTTGYSRFYTRTNNLGTLYDFAFSWADEHRKQLSSFKSPEAMYAYLLSQPIFDSFLSFAKDRKLVPTGQEISKSRTVITERINLLIARDILGDAAFYELWVKQDKAFAKALETVSKL